MKKYNHAITRLPPQSMANGITTQNEIPDLALAHKQHEAYLHTLRSLGITVTVLEPEEDFPDSHFVEDAAIIHNGVAILTRPGAIERRGEVAKLKPVLEKILPVRELGGGDAAILDGGDVLFMGQHVFVGISYRTNLAGADELEKILLDIDPSLTVHRVEFSGVLHLKSGITAIGSDLLLGNPKMKLAKTLPAGRIIWLPENEGYAANALTANGAVIYFEECPSVKTAALAENLNPIAMDMSEFRKMDGSFTCLSLLW